MDKSEIAKSIIEYIEQQLKRGGEALSLDEIAEKVGYSKFYLNRTFQEETAITIHQYVFERRLTEAAKKLVYTDKAIVDIAYETGYQSQQAFTNAFRSIYLCAPMKYRIDRKYFPIRKAYQMQSILSFYSYSRLVVAA